MKDLLIKNATVVSPADKISGRYDILVMNGKIAQIGENLSFDGENIDAEGLYAIPGLVDMHVHLRDPGQTQKEDIFTGCRAAAAGGVTSLLAMPNTTPATDSGEVVRYILDKAKDADANVYVAASMTKGLKSLEPTDIEELKNAGAIALTDDGRPVENTKFLSDAMKKAPLYGMRVVAHCEDLYLADGGKINEGEVSEKLGVKGIPASAEDCGTAREIALAAALDVPVHICHVSTKTSVELIRDAKNRGVKVTAETAPHYFSLTDKELLRGDADFRMNPPLRTISDMDEIINGLLDGTLDAIATDHAPHTVEDKADFVSAPNGSIGMETSLAVGITCLVKRGLLSFEKLVEKMSVNPARILGINAGTLAVGAPADIALVDLDEEWVVDVDRLHGKSKNTPFKGRRLCGKVKKTILGGKVVFDE
ncbi:dihydroorotase [Ruminococcus sp.]|uniref:dihydroorotase n=1 Tax=Ruminococcus sp. TaxID=41978 RepID=UPI003F039A71